MLITVACLDMAVIYLKSGKRGIAIQMMRFLRNSYVCSLRLLRYLLSFKIKFLVVLQIFIGEALV